MSQFKDYPLDWAIDKFGVVDPAPYNQFSELYKEHNTPGDLALSLAAELESSDPAMHQVMSEVADRRISDPSRAASFRAGFSVAFKALSLQAKETNLSLPVP